MHTVDHCATTIAHHIYAVCFGALFVQARRTSSGLLMKQKRYSLVNKKQKQTYIELVTGSVTGSVTIAYVVLEDCDGA